MFSLLVLVGIGTLIAAAPKVAAEGVVLDRVVAVVNDEIILESDLDLWMIYDENVRAELAKLQNPTEERVIQRFEELRPQGLDELIARKLMLAHAPQFQISATDAEVEAYLQNLARRAGLTGVADLKKAVEGTQRYGTWKQYRYKLREDIIIFKLKGMLLNTAVSDEQVLARYRELSKSEEARMEVRRLVFRAGVASAERDAQYKQAKAVVRRLTEGEDVEVIASELEQDAELEELVRSSVSRPIGQRLFAAKAGDVVGPLESAQGYVVFVVEEVITSDLLGFEEAKEQLRADIKMQVEAKATRELREKLRARAHVDIRL